MSDTGRETYLAMHETYHRSLRAERLSACLQAYLNRPNLGVSSYVEVPLRRDDLELLIEVLREHI